MALDFNLNVGDTITQCYHDTIKNIDSVSIGGSYRKRLYTKGGNQMIEGIGGVIEIFYNAYCGQHMSPYVGFICFTEDSITYLSPNASGTCPTISNSVGIENYQLSTLNCQLTPNPTTGIFTIHTEGTNIKEIKVFTVLGEEVGITNYKLPISPSTPLRVTDEVTVDMSGFAKGIYFVRITDEKKTVVNKKIVVQ